MKLRLRNNSIRLRLLRGEVQELAKNGSLEESIFFGLNDTDRLTYKLQTDFNAETISANFVDQTITVLVPTKVALDWIETEKVGLSFNQKSCDNDDKSLRILIEKDFVCLDRRDDPDDADAFPHPTGENSAKIKC